MNKFFTILIHNIGKPPEIFQVWQNECKRPVLFKHNADALEAIRVIRMLKTDIAFLGAETQPIEWDLP